jgi:cytoskeleton protein RodZ
MDISIAATASDAGDDALSPGEALRQAREARGESLSEVAQALKLSLAQLAAIEGGKFDTLPGPTFVRGFVRNYARHLGLEAEPLLARLEAGGVAGVIAAAVDLTPVSNARGDMPLGDGARASSGSAPILLGIVVAALVALLVAGLYFGWFETQPEPFPVVVEPSDPEIIPEAEGVAAEAGALPDAAPVATVATPEASAPVPAQESAAPATTVATAPATPPVRGQKPVLRFSFTGEAWFEVREGRDGSGRILDQGVGAAGSIRNIQGTPPFSLVVGNARNVKVEFNGKPVDLTPHTKVSVARLTLQ